MSRPGPREAITEPAAVAGLTVTGIERTAGDPGLRGTSLTRERHRGQSGALPFPSPPGAAEKGLRVRSSI
ncbi:hypothetical protein ABZ470_20580 [Streptosporangium sp. NPDC020072]|uniref:hypothetical protein n=1 Tax=Streptosporangium sp. NPDC020072 TaxID=3154788 RepID=UPI0034209FC8